MPANPHVYWLAAVIGLGVLCTNALGQLPVTKMQNGVSYLSGGIGDDEEIQIRRAASEFGVLLEFTEIERGKPHGHWSSDVDVRVKSGTTILINDRSNGPLMLIRLAPGSYVIEAERAGVKQSRQTAVKANAAVRERFIWTVDTELQPR